jgi:hypothetical protein
MGRGGYCPTVRVEQRRRSLQADYFFFPGPPGFACVEENGETGVPAFGLGCLGFFASLLLLSCPLAMRNSPEEHLCMGGRPEYQLPAAAPS